MHARTKKKKDDNLLKEKLRLLIIKQPAEKLTEEYTVVCETKKKFKPLENDFQT